MKTMKWPVRENGLPEAQASKILNVKNIWAYTDVGHSLPKQLKWMYHRNLLSADRDTSHISTIHGQTWGFKHKHKIDYAEEFNTENMNQIYRCSVKKYILGSAKESLGSS